MLDDGDAPLLDPLARLDPEGCLVNKLAVAALIPAAIGVGRDEPLLLPGPVEVCGADSCVALAPMGERDPSPDTAAGEARWEDRVRSLMTSSCKMRSRSRIALQRTLRVLSVTINI